MNLEELKQKYDKLQKKYGSKELHSVYFGGCINNPNICFVFMNPTKRNIASLNSWDGIRVPWIGTKNIWDLFYSINLVNTDMYNEIKSLKPKDWTKEFANKLYEEVIKNKYFITNLAKCSQDDARPLPDSVFKQYLNLFYKEIELTNPKVVILFGNQVSSLVLNQKITVSTCRKQPFIKKIKNKEYKFYSVYYPIGNGRFNIDKAIEDINYIIGKEVLDGKITNI